MQTLLDDKLLKDGCQATMILRHGALGIQGDGSQVRLELFLKVFEYVRGTFVVDGGEVVGGTILAVGPPRTAPRGMASVGALTDPRRLADVGLIRRTGNGLGRLAFYLNQDSEWNEQMLDILSSPGPSAPRDTAPPVSSGPIALSPSSSAASRGSPISVGERSVAAALEKMGFAYETQHGIPNPIPFAPKYKVDFYLPSIRLVVEYDGEYHFPRVGVPSSGVERDVYKAMRFLEDGIGILRVAKAGIPAFERLGAVSLAEISVKSSDDRRPAYIPDTAVYDRHREVMDLAMANPRSWLMANLPAIIGKAGRGNEECETASSAPGALEQVVTSSPARAPGGGEAPRTGSSVAKATALESRQTPLGALDVAPRPRRPEAGESSLNRPAGAPQGTLPSSAQFTGRAFPHKRPEKTGDSCVLC
jgi:hypothetical protein